MCCGIKEFHNNPIFIVLFLLSIRKELLFVT